MRNPLRVKSPSFAHLLKGEVTSVAEGEIGGVIDRKQCPEMHLRHWRHGLLASHGDNLAGDVGVLRVSFMAGDGQQILVPVQVHI